MKNRYRWLAFGVKMYYFFWRQLVFSTFSASEKTISPVQRQRPAATARAFGLANGMAPVCADLWPKGIGNFWSGREISKAGGRGRIFEHFLRTFHSRFRKWQILIFLYIKQVIKKRAVPAHLLVRFFFFYLISEYTSQLILYFNLY